MSTKPAGDTRTGAVTGATAYEFKMQIRRKALWIVMAVFVIWGIAQFGYVYFQTPVALPLAHTVAGWSMMMQAVVPVGFGIMLADRLPRDRANKVDELFETLPSPPGGRLLGKYLGATLATLVPVFSAYAAAMTVVAVERGEVWTVPLGMLSFATVNLPGLLFVAAFSVSVPAILWVPLYQFLFVGYWFWRTLLSPEGPIPTLSGTWLNPLGEHAANGFFGARTLYANDASVWEGAASVALLLGLGALALLCAHRYLRRQRARR